MNTERFELLKLISEGNYMPIIHAHYHDLRWLYNQEFIQYGWQNVQVTEKGKAALVAQKAGAE